MLIKRQVKMNINERLKQLREDNGLSQEELAEQVGITRSAISQIENGKRELNSVEIQAFCKLFHVSADYLLGFEKGARVVVENKKTVKQENNDIRISVPAKKVKKFEQVLLYLLEKCAGKNNVGETVIYKLLYFIDFNYYELYEEQLIGATYRKLPFGPVPLEFEKICEEMEKRKKIEKVNTTYMGYTQKRYLPLVKADLRELTAAEIKVIDDVIERLGDKSAKWLSEYSHGDVPWQSTPDKMPIDYELVFYRTPAYSVRDYSEVEDD